MASSSYTETIDWLYSLQAFGMKLGLENIRRLLDALGNPQSSFPIFHVAGTNGKGSTCAMLASILQQAGYQIGLFTSPHLMDYRERIKLNGIPLSSEATLDGLSLIREKIALWDPSPTFFEVTLALAFHAFVLSDCEVIVLETGMGGRLDATNIVTPCVSLITPIGYDHQKWLGDTLTEIALEKAGIFKPHIPAVSAAQPKEVKDALVAKAVEMQTPLSFVSQPWDGDIALHGAHQRSNAALALAALDMSGLSIDPPAKEEGLRHVHWPGRFQHWGKQLILDGAHNPHAARVLVETWKSIYPGIRARIVFGGLKEKHPQETLHLLESIASEFIFVPVRSPRTESPDHLSQWTALPSRVATHLPTVLDEAQSIFSQPTLITGSLYLIGEALAILHGVETPAKTTQ